MISGFAQIPLGAYLFLAVSLFGLVLTCLYGLRPYLLAARNPGVVPLADCGPDVPKASVVMYCQSDGEILLSALESVCTQDYPDYEVVVVCDAGMEYARNIAELAESRWPHVYVTFLQPGSRNLSRRKLANMIGIKAAKGDVVITTQANIRIPSDRWISGMMEPFCGERGKSTDVVLGLSHMDFSELRGIGKWYRRFDSVLADALWVGYAAAKKPYRGDGFNLALRRSVFFDHKGYAKSMFLQNGEDDVYMQEICNADNTKVVTSSDTVLTTVWGDSADRVWTLRKASYAFTSRWLPCAPFFRAGFTELMQWLVSACAAAGAFIGKDSLWPVVASCLIVGILWIADMLCYRGVSRTFNISGFPLAAPFLWLWHPVANIFFRLAHAGTYKKNFTWQR